MGWNDTGEAVSQRRHFILDRLLARIARGQLTIIMPDGERLVGRGTAPGPAAEVHIHRRRAFRRLLLGGDLGFAEAYIDGDWTTPDLPRLLEFGAVNLDAINEAVGHNRLGALIVRLRHLLNTNTRAGSRRNISFHYDLGNAFYRQWLDADMIYSSALYRAPDQSLESAQAEKLARITDLMAIEGGQAVLEIGCGWGALACHLAARGATVTGLTLSSEQQAEARARVAGAGLDGRVDIRLEDYRDVGGRFDRIVSIEMIEAVGERYWPVYFRTLRERLAAGGRAVIQAITIAEDRFDDYRRTPDFIQRHVFPGGMLPTRTVIADEADRAGLRLVAEERFGQSYALTLAEWRRRFLDAWPAIEAQGFDEGFRRLWDYYLAYCIAGFRTGGIDVGLYVLE